MEPECPGTFAEGGAAGHDVVDHQNLPSAEVGHAFENTPDIGRPLGQRQFGLGGIGAPAAAAMDVYGQPESPPDDPGDLARLVEAPFTQAGRMQGQGNDRIELTSGQSLGQQCAEPPGEGQLSAVLEAMDQAIEREIVAIEGRGSVEVGRFGKAAAAVLTSGSRFATARAAGRWQGR